MVEKVAYEENSTQKTMITCNESVEYRYCLFSDIVIPKIKFSLRAISALGLDKEDFSSIEKITDYCDAVSKPLQYLPG